MKEYTNSGNKDTRSGFGAGLLEAGRRDGSIVAMAATEYQAEDEGEVDGEEETTPVQPIETGEQQ